MKTLLYIVTLFFLPSIAEAQDYYTNDPERAEKIINGYLNHASERGVEVRERILTIDKIYFLKGETSHKHKNGECTIKIGVKKHQSDWETLTKAYHEIGHHLGLDHCSLCYYNIMAELRDNVPNYFRHPAIQKLYIDLYFEQVRNPSNPHKHY